MSADIVERLRQYEGDISQTTMCYSESIARAALAAKPETEGK